MATNKHFNSFPQGGRGSGGSAAELHGVWGRHLTNHRAKRYYGTKV